MKKSDAVMNGQWGTGEQWIYISAFSSFSTAEELKMQNRVNWISKQYNKVINLFNYESS